MGLYPSTVDGDSGADRVPLHRGAGVESSVRDSEAAALDRVCATTLELEMVGCDRQKQEAPRTC